MAAVERGKCENVAFGGCFVGTEVATVAGGEEAPTAVQNSV